MLYYDQVGTADCVTAAIGHQQQARTLLDAVFVADRIAIEVALKELDSMLQFWQTTGLQADHCIVSFARSLSVKECQADIRHW